MNVDLEEAKKFDSDKTANDGKEGDTTG